MNQRERKKQLKTILKDKNLSKDDDTYYTPKFFRKTKHRITGETFYELNSGEDDGRNYWADREKGDWSHMPRLYEDDCEVFYQ